MIIETFSPWQLESKADADNAFTFTGRDLVAAAAAAPSNAMEATTAECAGVEKSLEQWGIGQVSGQFASKSTDTVTFNVRIDAVTDAAPFAFNSWVALWIGRKWNGTAWTGGSRWFYGQVRTNPRKGTAGGAFMTYTLQGVWSCLERRIFEQPWWVWDTDIGALSRKNTSDIFLNVKTDLATGAYVMATTAEQIRSVMDWGRANGDPYLVGDIPAGVLVPIDEVRDVVSAEVVRRQLRWQPDSVGWVDYSTLPYPTIHFTRRASLSAVSFAVGAKPLSEFEVTPRYDLVPPCVVLKYQVTDEIDGVPRLSIRIDKWPATATGDELGAFKATVNLIGTTASWVSADVQTAAIPDGVATGLVDDATKDWWYRHYPYYAATGDGRTKSVLLVSASSRPAGFGPYLYEKTGGQIADWMSHVAGGNLVNVISRQEPLTATFEETTTDTATGAKSILKKTVSLNIATTNALPPASGKTFRTYSTLETYSAGDPVPTGLAQSIYECLSAVQYSGFITLTEEEINTAMALQGISNRPGVGLCVNLTGGETAWATMRAMVQQSAVDLTPGSTTLTFGPAPHLGFDDLIELLHVTRVRQIYTNPRARGGSLSAGSRISLGRDVSSTNTDGGAMSHSQIRVASQDYEAPTDLQKTEFIDIEYTPAVATAIQNTDAVLASQDKCIKPRETAVCDNGVVKYCMLLRSDYYTKA